VVKAALQLGFGQSLKLTPQLTQAIKLLTMSTLELELEVTSLLESNPVLEREEELARTTTMIDGYPRPSDDASRNPRTTSTTSSTCATTKNSADWNEPFSASSFCGDDGERELRDGAPDLRANSHGRWHCGH
jgi:RNA polymerase sigma-54 factor